VNEIVKSLIEHFPAWPLVILLIAITLRKQIKELLTQAAETLKRVNTFSWKHKEHTVEASTQVASQVIALKSADNALGAGTGIVSIDASPDASITSERDAVLSYGKGVQSVDDRAAAIRAELSRLNFPQSDAGTTDLLVRQLAVSNCIAHFEQTYRLIFGSQIAALEFLNVKGNQDTANLRPFYDSGTAAQPAFYATYPFEKWTEFLSRQKLIARLDDPQRVGITALGKDFLVWIVNSRLSRERKG
jgi:hypothetical protein